VRAITIGCTIAARRGWFSSSSRTHALLKRGLSNPPRKFKAEDAQRVTNFVLEIDLLREQRSTIDEQHAKLLAYCALHGHDAEPPDPHAVCDGARIIAVTLHGHGFVRPRRCRGSI
jgi:hypothetical protein